MIAPLGNNLIFLVSQPRSGSTLLQRILGGHSDIHTTSEPWFMLEACEPLQPRSGRQPFEAGGWARLARDEFLKSAGGRTALVEGIRAFAGSVYDRALANSGKPRFLDKTPRYYYILQELNEIFPDARIVILLRNPLAVLCSVVRTWVQEHYERMPVYRDDLLLAPQRLADGIRNAGSRVCILRYEELVSDPVREVGALCAWLGLPFEPGMLSYGGGPSFVFGDPDGVQRHTEPKACQLEQWQADLRNPAIWRLASDYLLYLQRVQPDPLGYPITTLESPLAAYRPPAWRRRWTRGLAPVLNMKSLDLPLAP